VSFLPVYFDASALLKLVVTEDESSALADAIERWPDRVSASIVRVEMHRVLRRTGQPKAASDVADAILAGVVLIRIDEPVLTYAARLGNPQLRALDAIHLAAALTIGDDPAAFVTYDARLARAARQEGLSVLHPGVKTLTGRL
jgi:predicted nucleic acid-binding protein